MFKPLLKYTLIAVVWKRYKAIIVSGLCLFVFIIMVIIGHNDYVRYIETTGQQSQLAISFLLKWGLIIAAIWAYIIYIKLTLKVTTKSKQLDAEKPDTNNNVKNDAFASLRKKEKLCSRTDKMLDSKR